MDLGKYIHQLLKHRNEVYVKGLGVFKRIHTPSVYDDRRGVYLPPVTYLEFDGKSVNGVDFIDYIQQSTQSTRQAAESDVHDAVLNLLESIKENGSATLNHLGQLIKHGNSLVFKAEDLSGFQLQPIEGAGDNLIEETPAEETTPILDDKTVEESSHDENLEHEESPTENQVEEVYEEPQVNNKSKWYIWAALLAIVVIAGLLYVNHTNSIKKQAKKTDSLLNAGIEEPDTAKTNIADTTNAAVNSVTDTSAAPVKKVYNPLIPENHTYQIVIGTHATLAQAYEQAESFNKAGIESVRVIPSNLAHNKKKVIWDSYETKEKADSALRVVRKQYVADAWNQKIK
ncbi:hypothetical protein [Sphingobacterium endophyticum]|uniref:hypothetical protein n=1 Tax=Sphingobacterium endophyticum TaxID=2546448 RepID=UPI0012E23B16|nr:hypothetical protein [Sphingobacterium endophyticum]